MRNKISNSVSLKLSGLNFERLLNFFINNNIRLKKIVRHDYKTFSFIISKSAYNKVKKLNALKNYEVLEVEVTGIDSFINNTKTRIGLMVGVCTSIVLFSVLSLFTFNIQVMGTAKIDKQSIVNFLSKHDIKMYSINSFDNEVVENKLSEEFEDISMVSVKKMGTNIIINIKEKELLDDSEYESITAPCNLYITHLEVYQGTSVVKLGDFVKEGQPLVMPYVDNVGGERLYVKPLVKIGYDAWYTGSVEFDQKETLQVTTGKKTTKSYYTIFGVDILKSTKSISYKNYKTKTYNSTVFKNFFIPLKFNKTVYYETKEVVKEYDYEKYKEQLYKQSKLLAYKKLPEGMEVLDEKVVEGKYQDKIIVQTVLYIKNTIIQN